MFNLFQVISMRYLVICTGIYKINHFSNWKNRNHTKFIKDKILHYSNNIQLY